MTIPTELWAAVGGTDKDIHHACTWPEGCHEHINDAIAEHDIEDAKQWVVRRYVLESAPPRRWVERWHGSGPDRGWWVWETGHGDRIAYCGEGEFAERLCSLIVEKHNATCGVSLVDGKTFAPSVSDGFSGIRGDETK